jgi:hypothetical protein
MSKNQELIVNASELSKVDDNSLNAKQLQYLLKRTPKNHIYERTAKGGGKWSYVTGTYVKKVLNLMFGWDWSFEVQEYKFDLDIGQVFVLGKLTVNTGGKSIIKMQFGRQDIKFKNDWVDGKKTKTQNPLDLGNDLKAATTDCLKKCASELGIASDIYGKNEFKEIQVVENPKAMDDDEKLVYIKKLMSDSIISSKLKEDDLMYIERIIEEKETNSYNKIIKELNNLNKQ